MSRESKHIFNETWWTVESNFSFFPESAWGKVCSSNFPQEFFPIVSLFAEDCNYNLYRLSSHDKRLFIEGRNGKGDKMNELMLRYGEKRLVVARVQFIHRRNGNMTKLYSILKKLQKKYSLDKIVIESVLTNEMENWCCKNGFVRKMGGILTLRDKCLLVKNK